jgi:uncharacterized integral membrane protein
MTEELFVGLSAVLFGSVIMGVLFGVILIIMRFVIRSRRGGSYKNQSHE